MSADDRPDLPYEEVRATGPALVDEDGEAVGDALLGIGDDPRLATLSADIAELTGDVQRVQAEYTNYRRRVERDREATREQAVAGTLAELLPVLDDIGRARAHGELDGAFRSVAESLETTVAKLGLERFGEPGEPFDPLVHEAISHEHSPDVSTTTCIAVLQPGYRFAGRVVRPARVAVADPE